MNEILIKRKFNMLKKVLLSAVAFSSLSMGISQANPDLNASTFDLDMMADPNAPTKKIFSLEEMNYVVETTNSKEEAEKQAIIAAYQKGYEEAQAYENSWKKYAKDTAVDGAKWLGEKIIDNANYYARLGLSWHLNYYGINALEEATAQVVGFGAAFMAGPIAGPVAGASAYATAKAGIRTARYVLPGFEGYFSGALAPITKTVVVDPAIAIAKKVPVMAKAGYKAASSAVTAAGNAYNAFSSWYYG